MINRTLLFPYFIDAPLPALARAAGPDWDTLPPAEFSNASGTQRLAALYPPFADWVARTAAAGDRPVTFAGDCCTAIPMLAGLQRAGIKPTLIWFDAHGDFNTWGTTPSGFLGGMPLAWLVGRGEQTVPKAVGLRPLPESDVILTDARDLDPGEREAVAGSGLTHLASVLDLIAENAQKPPPPPELAMRSAPDRPIWVHFDTDVLRPEDAPAMNYLAPGGPSAAKLGKIFDRIAGTGQLCAVSVSAWNPDLDPERKTEKVVMILLERLLASG